MSTVKSMLPHLQSGLAGCCSREIKVDSTNECVVSAVVGSMRAPQRDDRRASDASRYLLISSCHATISYPLRKLLLDQNFSCPSRLHRNATELIMFIYLPLPAALQASFSSPWTDKGVGFTLVFRHALVVLGVVCSFAFVSLSVCQTNSIVVCLPMSAASSVICALLLT